MKINSQDFLVQEGDKVELDKWSTLVEPVYSSCSLLSCPLFRR